MVTDGGGWTVFQRRQDGSVDFYRYWTDYENGFGNLTGEFWLGLSKINRLTKEQSNTLRVDLGDFSNNKVYAQYTTFSVGDSTTKYTLTVGGYSGTAGDSLANSTSHHRIHNGMKFSTRDRKNDKHPTFNCAWYHSGAWWYNYCQDSGLNGPYRHTPVLSTEPFNDGIIWYQWKGWYYSLKFTEMKTRRNN